MININRVLFRLQFIALLCFRLAWSGTVRAFPFGTNQMNAFIVWQASEFEWEREREWDWGLEIILAQQTNEKKATVAAVHWQQQTNSLRANIAYSKRNGFEKIRFKFRLSSRDFAFSLRSFRRLRRDKKNKLVILNETKGWHNKTQNQIGSEQTANQFAWLAHGIARGFIRWSGASLFRFSFCPSQKHMCVWSAARIFRAVARMFAVFFSLFLSSFGCCSLFLMVSRLAHFIAPIFQTDSTGTNTHNVVLCANFIPKTS